MSEDATAPQEAVEDRPVVGLNGRPARLPERPWFAAVDASGALVRDEDGRLVRVRRR